MADANDGGPAFPVPPIHSGVTYVGMSLRDWFAGQALAGILGNQKIDRAASLLDLTTTCYAAADAMLTERERRDA